MYLGVNPMTFTLLCITFIGLLIGMAMCYAGYRWFLILLPIWGFFFGFGLGVQTVQVLFNEAFLATVTSWVVGFIAGLIFAVLSYLFYFVAVALISGALGYFLAVGLLTGLGLDLSFIVWLIGLAAGVVVAFVVLFWNLQKFAIIAITALGGAAVIIFTLLAGFGNLSLEQLAANPVGTVISESFWWALLFVFLAVSGVFVQVFVNREWEAESYNRLAS